MNSIFDELFGGNFFDGRYNAIPTFPGDQRATFQQMLMNSIHQRQEPRYRSIKPKTPMTAKAVKLFQVSSLLGES